MISRFLRVATSVAGCWMLAVSWGPGVSAEMVEYSAGHADIGLAIESPTELFLHYHFGVGSAILDGVHATIANEELEPSEAYVRIADSTIVNLPSTIDFLGNDPGSQVWILPQGNTSGLPFLGIASEELDGLGFTSAGFRLTGMSGPTGGNFAVWQNSALGSSTVFMRSSDGIDPAIDFVPSIVGGHDHYFYGFTKPGIYDLEILGFASGSPTLGSLTDAETFRFVVGSATAVPEPISLGLLLIGGLGCIVHRRRRGLMPEPSNGHS